MTKRLLYILSSLFIIVLLISLFSSFVSAENEDEEKTAEQLEPACDEVVFLRDVTEEEIEYLDGWGFDIDNPLVARDHYNFDPDEDNPKNYLQTALYQATEWFEVSGGTIVICGPVYLGDEQAYGFDLEKDVLTAEFGENTIKFTSVYDGVDYRKTNNAKIILDGKANLSIFGQSIWENIDIETKSADRVISFNGYKTLIGEGVNCYPYDESLKEIPENYVSLVGGNRFIGSEDMTTDLYVKSGSYNVISAGMWGKDNKNNMAGNSVTNLVLDGTTTVYGQVVGTTVNAALFSGNVNITINSGQLFGDVNIIGKSGIANQEGRGILKINGGDFSKCWSISDCAFGIENNYPSYSLIDFSGWTEKIGGIKVPLSKIISIDDIKYPDGITQKDIEEIVEETEYIESTVSTEEVTEKVDSNKNSKKGGLNAILVGVIAVCLSAGVAVCCVFIIKKKR